MSSIIGFLERVGRDSRLRHAGGEELTQALSDEDIDATKLPAVLCRDLAAMKAMLNVDPTLCCLVYVPEDDDDGEEREDDGGEGDDDIPPETPEDEPGQ